MGKKTEKQTEWTPLVDEVLLEEVARQDVYGAKHGTVASTWGEISAIVGEHLPAINGRACKDRLAVLAKAFKRQDRGRLFLSGVTEDVTNADKLLYEICERQEEVVAAKSNKRKSEAGKADALQVAGESLLAAAETRVAKRLAVASAPLDDDQDKDESHPDREQQAAGSNCSTPAKPERPRKVDPIEAMLELEKKKHEDDHKFRMQQLAVQQREQEIRAAAGEAMRVQQTQLADLIAHLLSQIPKPTK